MRFSLLRDRRVLICTPLAALAAFAFLAFVPSALPRAEAQSATPPVAPQPAAAQSGASSSAISTPLSPAEAALKKTLETRIGAPIDGLAKTVLGLYEFRVGDDLLYTDANGDYLVAGNLIDLRTRENLTRKRAGELREASLPTFKFADLPLDNAIKVVKGNGKRKVAIFEDPNCGYCRRLEASLHSISDVTVYVFLYPVLGPDSLAKSKQLWCSANRSKAWTDWMEKNTPLTGEGACATPLDKTLELGKKLKVDGTPTLFFANNKRTEGAIEQAELEKLLAAS